MTFSPSVLVTDDALEMMRTAGLAALPSETGGILVGFRTEDQVVVTRATVVPDADSSRRDYMLRKQRASLTFIWLQAIAGPVAGYVGDWHTHPADVPASSTDIASLERIAAAATDLVALLVLPSSVGEPKPPYAYVGVRLSSRRFTRRRGTLTQSAPLRSTRRSADELERQAEAALREPKEESSP